MTFPSATYRNHMKYFGKEREQITWVHRLRFYRQIIRLLDQEMIDLLLIPNKSKQIVEECTQNNLQILFNNIYEVTNHIEVLLTENNVPLHRYTVK